MVTYYAIFYISHIYSLSLICLELEVFVAARLGLNASLKLVFGSSFHVFTQKALYLQLHSVKKVKIVKNVVKTTTTRHSMIGSPQKVEIQRSSIPKIRKIHSCVRKLWVKKSQNSQFWQNWPNFCLKWPKLCHIRIFQTYRL